MMYKKNDGKIIITFKVLLELKLSSSDGNMRKKCNELGIYQMYRRVIGRYYELNDPRSYFSKKTIEMIKSNSKRYDSVLCEGDLFHLLQGYKKTSVDFDKKIKDAISKVGVAEQALRTKVKELIDGNIMAADINTLSIIHIATDEELDSLINLCVEDVLRMLEDKTFLSEKQINHIKVMERMKDEKRRKEKECILEKETLAQLLKRNDLTPETVSDITKIDLKYTSSWFFGWLYGIDKYNQLEILIYHLDIEYLFELNRRIENTEKTLVKFNKSIMTLHLLLRLSCIYKGEEIGRIFENKIGIGRQLPNRYLKRENFGTSKGYMSERNIRILNNYLLSYRDFEYPKISSPLDELITGDLKIRREELVNITNKDLELIAIKNNMDPMKIGLLYQSIVLGYISGKGHVRSDKAM